MQIAAELLEGTHRLSRFDEHTTQTGAVAFNDSTGQQRVLDFLSHPYGLDAERVSERAIPLDIDAGGPAPVRISVMHPLDCLRSRVANSELPGRATDHAEAQLRAAVALVSAYSQLLLDQDAHPREVMSINEQVYDLALRDHRAKRLYLEMGIDVSTAVLV